MRSVSSARRRYLSPTRAFAKHIVIEDDFFSCAALASTEMLYVRREAISTQSLTIVERGLVAQSGKIGLTVLGEDMILENVNLRHLAPATALTSLVAVTSLARDQLDSLLRDFPNARKVVVGARTRIAFQRAMVKVSQIALHREKKGHAAFDLTEAFDRFNAENPPAYGNFAIRTKAEMRIEELHEAQKATQVQVQALVESVRQLSVDLRSRSISGGKSAPARPRRGQPGSFKSSPPPLPRSAPPGASSPRPVSVSPEMSITTSFNGEVSIGSSVNGASPEASIKPSVGNGPRPPPLPTDTAEHSTSNVPTETGLSETGTCSSRRPPQPPPAPLLPDESSGCAPSAPSAAASLLPPPLPTRALSDLEA